jgi:hypothetical protein
MRISKIEISAFSQTTKVHVDMDCLGKDKQVIQPQDRRPPGLGGKIRSPQSSFEFHGSRNMRPKSCEPKTLHAVRHFAMRLERF